VRAKHQKSCSLLPNPKETLASQAMSMKNCHCHFIIAAARQELWGCMVLKKQAGLLTSPAGFSGLGSSKIYFCVKFESVW